jgi:large subunit ribosomal protein L19
MKNAIIEAIEKKQRKKVVPSFRVGDSVVVDKYIIEGKKKRIQKFEGLVTVVKGKDSRLSFSVRKVIGRVGVEKTYLLHSPQVENVTVTRKGKVRRARLYYIRKKIGAKASRVKLKES